MNRRVPYIDTSDVTEVEPLFLVKSGKYGFLLKGDSMDAYLANEIQDEDLGLYAEITFRDDSIIKNKFW